MLRLFAALPVPEDIVTRLIGLQTGLENAHWRPAENFHITLRFFGEVREQLARELDATLADIDIPPFELEIDGLGWFGRRKPRSVWAKVALKPELNQLAEACEQAARHIGLPPEARAFIPHITLAYLRTTPLEAVTDWCEAHKTFQAGPFKADRFHLVSSHFGKGPSRYVSEAEYPLE